MATITHPDTYICDLCGKEVDHARSITVPVHRHYLSPMISGMDNDGWYSNGYRTERIDLCFDCLKKVTVVDQFIDGNTETFKLKESE